LGTGQFLQKAANTLSDGSHTISLVIRDQSNATATNSVTIKSQRAVPTSLADLEVLLSSAPKSNPDERFRYSVTVLNHGPDAADEVNLMTTLSSNLVIEATEVTRGSCTGTNAISHCAIGPLLVGESAVVTYVTRGLGLATLRVSGSVVDPDASNDVVPGGVILGESSVPPSVSVTRNARQLQVSWPTSATGFSLQTADNLTPPVAWKPSNLSVNSSVRSFSTTTSSTNRAQFFRLIRP